jgi:hypothetical protein
MMGMSWQQQAATAPAEVGLGCIEAASVMVGITMLNV